MYTRRVVTGLHAMVYSDQPEALRAFFRDVVGWPAADVGDGWLIFDAPAADLGVHPTDHEGSPPTGTAELSLVCSDIHATVAELSARGAVFAQAVEDHGYGWVTVIEAPGGYRIQLYQPRYDKA